MIDLGVLCAYGGTEGRRYWMHFPGVASFSFDPDSEAVTASPPPTSARMS